MGIPFAKDYTATVTGTVFKTVRCEKCQTEYAYPVTRTASDRGTGFLFLDDKGAMGRAEGGAKEALRRELDNAIEAVPCPGCGWYQATMIPLLQSRVCASLRSGGAWLLAQSGLFLFLLCCFLADPKIPPDPIPVACGLIAAVTLGAAGSAELISTARARARYDPNAGDAESRLQQARSKGVLRADLDRMLAEQSSPGVGCRRRDMASGDDGSFLSGSPRLENY
jgi:hypothetical protein